ncbi:MAG: flagellar motor protein [Deltaproteobacteria bacterium]|nr:flagellar motor protein [Deltaproteobacteria bacterium]
MDLGSILGVVIAAVGIIVGMYLEGGSILQILQPTAGMIVFGGTIGACMIAFPLKTFIQSFKDLKKLIFEPKANGEELIKELVGYAHKARKDGILALEAELPKVKDPFLRKSLGSAVDGVEPKAARAAMELEIQFAEEHGEQVPKVFESAGGFAPTVGILGAVLGLIQVMQHLDNINEVGHGIAVAFVATIYGVGAANLFFLPAAGKLKIKHRQEIVVREMMVEGVIGILEGLSPRLLEDRLRAFVAHEMHKIEKSGGEKE